jgi:hypothetical protein
MTVSAWRIAIEAHMRIFRKLETLVEVIGTASPRPSAGIAPL